MRKVLLSCLAVMSLCVAAKELKYPVADIPQALLTNAHTVVRLYNESVEIKSDKEVVVNITDVRTVLNQNGLKYADLLVSYSPSLFKVTGIKGKIYDAAGKQVKSFGADDIKDYSNISDKSSLFEDDRVKHIDANYFQYPFTVEYSYELDMKQSFFIPYWSHGEEHVAYQKSIYTLLRPEGMMLKIKEQNIKNPAVTTTQKNVTTSVWQLENLPARIDEPLSSIYKVDYPLVNVVVPVFSVGNTQGSMESWKGFGMWIDRLLKDRDILPEGTVSQAKALVADCSSDFEKVKRIYEFMQKKTRYVNISIGIGGWQPLEAGVVDKFSYGDCKALTNYTRSLLNSVGIKSYYTLVKAGAEADAIDKDFVSNQFNHVFLCVPLGQDTTWLECTNQRLPCGFTGEFTDDRFALVVDGENTRLVKTRIYSAEQNSVVRNSVVEFNSDLDAVARIHSEFKGLKYSDMLPQYYADNADRVKYATQSVHLPSFDLKKCDYVETRAIVPVLTEVLHLSVTNYVKKLQGNMCFLPLNFMSKFSDVPDKVRNRKSEMTLRRDEMEKDTVRFILPKTVQVGQLPEPVELKSKFGRYNASVSVLGGVVVYVRCFEQKKGEFSADDYSAYRDFLEEVVAADEVVIGLKVI